MSKNKKIIMIISIFILLAIGIFLVFKKDYFQKSQISSKGGNQQESTKTVNGEKDAISEDRVSSMLEEIKARADAESDPQKKEAIVDEGTKKIIEEAKKNVK